MKTLAIMAGLLIGIIMLAPTFELHPVATESIGNFNCTSGKVTLNIKVGLQYWLRLTLDDGNSIFVTTPYDYPKGTDLCIPLSEHVIFEIDGYGIRYFQQTGKAKQKYMPTDDSLYRLM